MIIANDANEFLTLMKKDAEPRYIKAAMVLPHIEHSLELSQALTACDQRSFLSRYREEWHAAIKDLFDIRNKDSFYKQLKKLTKYKTGSFIPEKVKKNDAVIEKSEFARTIMQHVLKGVTKDITPDVIKQRIYLSRIQYNEDDISRIPLAISKNKAA